MLTLESLLQQELTTQLKYFSIADGWRLGEIARKQAGEDVSKIGISIKRGNQHLFYTAGLETCLDSEFWIKRKRNVVERHGHSSYYVRTQFAGDEAAYYQHQAVEPSQYAIHGGGFPIMIVGTGMIGSLVVSGLVSEEDHMICVNSLKELLKEQEKKG